MEIKPGYKQTEIGMIPEDWEITCIGEISIKVGSGITPTGGSKIYIQAGKPFVRSQNVRWGHLMLDDIVYIDEYTHSKFNSTEIMHGDVLLNITGASIGRCAIVDSRIVGGNVNQHVCIIRCEDNKLIPEYLMQTLISKSGQKQISEFQAGGNRQGLNFQQVKSIKIAKPASIIEQQEICSKTHDIDSLITSLEKLIEKKKLIKQGVMQELLTGKRRLPGFSGEWETKRYGEIFQFLSTANYTREELTDTGSIKYIHYGDIHTKFVNYVDLADASIPTIQDGKLKRYPLLEAGDLIMVDASEDYSGVGKSVEVISPNGIKAISGLHTILLRDTAQVFADGYRAYIHAIPSVKAQLDFYTTGMKVYSISKNNLSKIEIPVPPKQEQEAIVKVLRSLMDENMSLDVKLAKFKLLKLAMMQELLTGRIRLV